MKSLKGSRQIAVTSLAVLVVLLMPLSWALADTSPPYAEWSRTFGGSEDDSGLSVQETSDGGYIITGNTYSVSTGGWDAYLVKTDSQGREEWNRTFGGPDFDVGYSVRETIDGGYIIAGYTGPIDAPGARAYLVKTDSQGLEEWSRTLGDSQDDGGRSVQETSDGGYIITGHAIPFGADATDVYLVKTDSQGLEEWSRTFGGSSTDEGYSVQQTSDGGYIITGTTWSFGDGGGDVYLVKTDSQGLEEWSRTFGGSDFDVGYSVQETRDGGYIIAGVRDGVYTPPMTLRTNEAVFGDVYLVKTDSQGLEEWSRTFGGSEDDGGRSVQETSDGGYVIAGWTYSFGSGEGDVYFVKTNSQGTEGSSLTFGGSSTDEGYSVQETRDGEYIIAGITWSFGSGGVDVYLVKTDHLWSESEEEPITPPLPPLTPMLSNLAITPAEIESGDVVTISLDIENIGNQSFTYVVTLQIGELKLLIDVKLEAYESTTVSQTITHDIPGDYLVSVDGLTGSFTVKAPPKPAEFEFSDLRIFYPGVTPPEVEAGQTVTVIVSIEAENVGEQEGGRTVELKVDGEVIDSKEVPLEGGASETVLFELTRGEGIYEVEVEGFTESLTVNTQPEPEPEQGGIPGFPTLAIVIGVLLSLFILQKIQS